MAAYPPRFDPSLTLSVLRSQLIRPRLENTGPADDGYQDVIEQLWAERETFVLIEGDILPWPGAVEAIWDCPEPWCDYAFLLGGGYSGLGLGCVKFDASLMDEDPWIEGRPERWDEVDGRLLRKLQARGFKNHRHSPPVIHLHEVHWPQFPKGG